MKEFLDEYGNGIRRFGLLELEEARKTYCEKCSLYGNYENLNHSEQEDCSRCYQSLKKGVPLEEILRKYKIGEKMKTREMEI